MVLVPVAAFVTLFCRSLQFDRGVRAAFIRAAVIWGGLLLAVSEVLSAFTALRPIPLIAAWVFVALAAFPWRASIRLPSTITVPRSMAIPVALVLAVTFAVAIVAPPNTFDSMTYHMSRVVHWIQNHAIGAYPTNVSRQLYMAPWSELAIMHVQVLNGGSDRFANLVQWFAFIGCMVTASVVVAELGGSTMAQWLAVLLIATTPELIAESTSTQTDLVCAFWVMAFVSLLLIPNSWALAGLAMGLAVATKGTAYVFCLPFVLIAIYQEWRSRGFGAMAKAVTVLGAIAFTCNIGPLARNVRTYGDPLGDPDHVKMVASQTYKPNVIAGNILKNASLHLGTPFPAVNATLTRDITVAERGIGVDVDDWRDSVFGKFEVPMMNTHEDSTGNLLLFLLVLATLINLRRVDRRVRLYTAAVVGAGVLFSALFKWQPWNTRLHCALFVLAVVPAAVWVDTFLKRAAPTYVVATVLFACALPWVLLNASRPVFAFEGVGSVFTTPREDQYFVNNPDVREPLRAIAATLATTGCRTIGLLTDENSYEYPLWAMTRALSVRLEHIDAPYGVTRSTVPLRPCALVTIKRNHPMDAYAWRPLLQAGAAGLFVPGVVEASED